MATLTEEDIAEIRARAKREDDHDLWRYTTIERHLRAHSDRAKLLAHITEQSAQIARMDEALKSIESAIEVSREGYPAETLNTFLRGYGATARDARDLRRAVLTKAGTP